MVLVNVTQQLVRRVLKDRVYILVRLEELLVESAGSIFLFGLGHSHVCFQVIEMLPHCCH